MEKVNKTRVSRLFDEKIAGYLEAIKRR